VALEVARLAVARLDLRGHTGAHPRIGVVDVVPFVDLDDPFPPATSRSLAARNRFARRATDELDLPCLLYGPERSLPALRRLAPEHRSHPTAGICAVGARGALVAYNLWLEHDNLAEARRVAAALRRPGLRTLGLQVGDRVQVSCNLADPRHLGPDAAYDLVAAVTPVEHAELVGLIPRVVLDVIPPERWARLDLSDDRTIEARARAPGRGRGPG
jgi:glutamate formiminotransferase